MENHPIPQDVTGFKFRLIGSITVKQFLYLISAGAFALLFYFFPIPVLLKIPLMLLSAGIGLSLAFVPIDGRPMDKMIMNFIKTIPAENQYIYKKVGAEMLFFTFNPPAHAVNQVNETDTRIAEKTRMFNQLSKSYFKPDPEEQERVASLGKLFQEGQAPNQGFTNRVVNVDARPKIEPPVKLTAPVIPPKETKTETIAQSVAPAPSVSAPIAQSPAQTNPAEVATPPTGGASSSDVANILTGVVRDPRGKPLPHVIVEVIDTNGTPLRTFRTSQDGVFAAATPLPTGSYTIHLEDSLKRQNFTDVSVVLSGVVVPPVIVTSTDPREELRRELFGGVIQQS